MSKLYEFNGNKYFFNNVSFKQLCQQYVQNKGINTETARELIADGIGVSKDAVRKYCTTKTGPLDISIVTKIAKYFDVEVLDLLQSVKKNEENDTDKGYMGKLDFIQMETLNDIMDCWYDLKNSKSDWIEKNFTLFDNFYNDEDCKMAGITRENELKKFHKLYCLLEKADVILPFDFCQKLNEIMKVYMELWITPHDIKSNFYDINDYMIDFRHDNDFENTWGLKGIRDDDDFQCDNEGEIYDEVNRCINDDMENLFRTILISKDNNCRSII